MSWQAALLHDIGKFRERALGPKAAPGARYTHEAHSSEFVQGLRAFLDDEALQRGLAGAILRHHAPQYKDELLISVADIIAADERVESEEPHLTARSTTPLMSLLAKVGNLRDSKTETYIDLKPLQLERSVLFSTQNPVVNQEAYQRHWQAFHREALALLPQDWLGLFYLLRKYCWCIPSSASPGEEHDISLYDHLRVTAAIASCLEAEGLSQETLQQIRSGDAQARKCHRFLLVRGDISGIQDFIYTITSKGAARGLRGRSVYLQLLTEIIAHWILRKLDLPFVNILYHGGGHFMLLLPYRAIDKLLTIQQELSKKLLAAHGTDLYLALGWVPLSADNFGAGNFSSQWREAGKSANQAKQRRFSDLGEELYQLFEPQGSPHRRCDICQADSGPFELTSEGDIEKCHLCISFEKLGQDAARARYLMLSELDEEQNGGHGYAGIFASFGYHVDFLEEPQPPPQGARRAVLYYLNDTDFLSTKMLRWAQQARERNVQSSLGFRFLANVTPYDEDGNILDFDSLAAQSKGIERLGVLRMDVDNLGHIFSEGIPNATISRIATVSSMIQLFFEGWVHQVAEAFPQRLYSIYSGGDDLFFVGAWDAIVELAHKIHDDFAQFTQNDQITLSAGIAVEERKFPLYQAARNAGRALERAKALPGKNAIDFLGKTLRWTEFEKAHKLQQKLCELLQGHEGKAIPRSLLTKLSNVYALRKSYPERPRWTIRLMYDITQLGRQYEDFRDELQDLQLMIGRDEVINFLDVLVRWAQMLTMSREERRRS
ncbi:MAG: type III-A CRISPR-associated protein Cas10/Csm1 [Candidatus Methanomethylicaceae archaeon]